MVNQSVATAFLVALTQPNVGDTVLVGEDTYTFASSITPSTSPYTVLIGAGSNATLQNLLAAITFDNGAGTNNGILYSFNTIVNGQVAWAGNNTGQSTNVVSTATIGGSPYPYLQVFAPDYGAAFNSTSVAESTAGTRLVWLGLLSSLIPEVSTFTGGTNPSFNSQITGSSTWLEFLDPDTNVIKNQVVNDIYQRYYWASPSYPPQYNTLARIQANKSPWLLGINPPGCAPGVSVTGGGGSAQLGVTFSNGNTDFVGANTIYLIPITPVGQTAIVRRHVHASRYRPAGAVRRGCLHGRDDRQYADKPWRARGERYRRDQRRHHRWHVGWVQLPQPADAACQPDLLDWHFDEHAGADPGRRR